MIRLSLCLLALVAAATAPAQVEHCQVEDVSGGPDTPAPLITDWQWAQTFTCQAGGILSRLDVEYSSMNAPVGTVRLELRAVSDDLPDETANGLLAGVDVAVGNAPGVRVARLDLLEADIHVDVGDQLAVTMTATTDGYDVFAAPRWYGWTAGDYAGGLAYYRAEGLDWMPQEAIDLSFACWADCATPIAAASWSAVKARFSR